MSDSNQDDIRQVVLFRTGKLWEFDLARDSLKRHNIPFFFREESLSGVRMALPAMPTPGPGLFWTLIVPESQFHRAKECLQACRLDVEKDPLVWDFAPPPKGKQFLTIYVWIVLIFSGLFLLWRLLTLFRS
ncbi:MAG: hypothetical protein ABSE41_05220 [Bacteroidota bacterium]|jgi:hypothetical protein